MKKYLIIIIAIALLLLYSCAGKEGYHDDLSSTLAEVVKTEAYEEAAAALEENEPMPPKEIDIPARSIQKMERKLIKEGSISFESDDCSVTKALIQKAANDLGGYLSQDNEYSYNDRIQHNITIRIPSANFDQLLALISESVKELDDQNITVKDVTEEYVDVQARLKAKKKVEQRYIDLLNKAHTVGDILQVENELARLREQIESTEGRLRYLKDQVSLSTLNISYYQTTETGFGFGGKAKEGLQNGYNGLLWFFIGLINIWPFILFMGAIAWLIVRLIKKSRKKNK